MRLNSKWNRRGFLSGLAAIASLFALPRRTFAGNGPDKKASGLTGWANPAIPMKNWE